ncbi:MAG: type II toxin-antitoxin system HicB family antitoxin [Bosea sp. (in: a-proteobacteria)]
MSRLEYAVIVEPLPNEEGGGFLVSVPDLPGCMTDVETPELAMAAAVGVIEEWIEEARRLGRDVPQPTKRVA